MPLDGTLIESFVDLGGGHVICPGRHFAKQEIMMAIAILVTKFDIELVEWTTADGKRSDRPAQDNCDFAGAIAMPPDRDMKVRWRRLW
jgi:cytochrome P450